MLTGAFPAGVYRMAAAEAAAFRLFVLTDLKISEILKEIKRKHQNQDQLSFGFILHK
jgi:hypothetical protein